MDDDDDVLGSDAERSAMKATILKVAINLTNEGLLGAREANVVNDMINRENPVLVAAFKVRSEDTKKGRSIDQLLLLREGMVSLPCHAVVSIFYGATCWTWLV